MAIIYTKICSNNLEDAREFKIFFFSAKEQGLRTNNVRSVSDMTSVKLILISTIVIAFEYFSFVAFKSK